MTLAVAILMKDPAEAKTRLRPVLGDDAREKLAAVLFENTLAFFARFHAGKPLAVVSRSPRIAALSRARGAEALADEALGGINAAARRAAAWAGERKAEALLVVHADVPALADAEVAALVEAASRHAVVIARSRDGGTNALLLTPPDAIPFAFGPGSAAAHEAAARAAGRGAVSLDLRCLSRDLDTPDDLAACRLPPGAPPPSLQAFAVAGMPEVSAGDSLAALIAEALERTGARLDPGDIVVVAQKIVSKGENRLARLADYEPSAEARRIAAEIGKDARKVEAILRESSEVVRMRRQPPDGLLVTRHRHGWICANAGIDESNLGTGREGMLLLLPEDPDASAARLRAGLEARFGGPLGVVVTDTFGRPWRNGLVNVAIGVAGVPAVVDWTRRTDAYGRGLKATLPAFADEIAAAAGLLMAKDAGLPVVVLRGLAWQDDPGASARDVLRPLSQELFL